jgi:hypothetical protein
VIRLHLLLSTLSLFLAPVAALAGSLLATWTIPLPNSAAWPLILSTTIGSFYLVDWLSRRVVTPRCLHAGCPGRYTVDRSPGARVVYACPACGDRRPTSLHWED